MIKHMSPLHLALFFLPTEKEKYHFENMAIHHVIFKLPSWTWTFSISHWPDLDGAYDSLLGGRQSCKWTVPSERSARFPRIFRILQKRTYSVRHSMELVCLLSCIRTFSISLSLNGPSRPSPGNTAERQKNQAHMLRIMHLPPEHGRNAKRAAAKPHRGILTPYDPSTY